MKLLLDTCIWGGAADELRMRGHDVIWSGDWDEDPGDEEILTTALAQGRILVTLDKDFGELAVVRRGLCVRTGSGIMEARHTPERCPRQERPGRNRPTEFTLCYKLSVPCALPPRIEHVDLMERDRNDWELSGQGRLLGCLLLSHNTL